MPPPLDPDLSLSQLAALKPLALAARDLRGSLTTVLEQEADLLTALEGTSDHRCAPAYVYTPLFHVSSPTQA